MTSELLASKKNNTGIQFDPRTKMAVLFTLVIIILGGSFQTTLYYTPALLPLLFFLFSKMWKSAAIYAVTFLACLCLQFFAVPYVPGVPGYLLMIIVLLPLYFSPSIAIAYYFVATTTVSEFIAGMERLHIPRQITIPMAVMFRVFPTVMEEWKAIGDAIPAFIELIGAVLVFVEFPDGAAVDERGIRIVIARIGCVPLAILETFLL